MNKAIAITEKNYDKIGQILKQGNGRAKTKCVYTTNLVSITAKVASYLIRFCKYKKYLEGQSFTYAPNEKYPKAYKYPAHGTCFEVKFRKRGKPYLISVSREEINKSTDKTVFMHVTDDFDQLILLESKTVSY